MQLKQTSDGLQVKHIPGCMWFIGVMFIIVASTFIYGFFGGFSNYNEIETWEYFAGLFVAVAVLTGGIYVISIHPLIITDLSSKERKVTISKRNFLRKEEKVFKFAEVSSFETIEEKDSDDDSFFYIYLHSNSGEKIKISSMGLQNEAHVVEINDELNRYLEKEKLLNK